MTDRERFIATITGQPVDRPPFLLMWGPWGTTWQRWMDEGKPEEVTDHRGFMNPDTGGALVNVNLGCSPRREVQILEEYEDRVVFIDSWGIKRVNFTKQESMSSFLDFPVKSRRDWEEFKEQWLDPDNPERLSGDWKEKARAASDAGCFLQVGTFPDVGLFGVVRWLLGDEDCLLTFCTDPDLIHDIMAHLTNLYLTVFDRVVQEVQVDVIHYWEDMCGRQGPLISPDMWNEFMGPHYREMKDFARANNIPVFSVDTDGDPDLIAQPMIDAGVNFLWPMEVAAGCDVAEWRRKYPSLAMLGGIDKRALALGPAAIDAEFERVRPAVEAGRYIPDLDHGIPDDVSWQDYLYYAQGLKKLVGA